ncbi:Uncharacterised protein [Mycobacteroides abscessus]|nr:Uncharacterised protein [Mycobacteroides abscessus]
MRTTSLSFAATERESHSSSVSSREFDRSTSKTFSICSATPGSVISRFTS